MPQTSSEGTPSYCRSFIIYPPLDSLHCLLIHTGGETCLGFTTRRKRRICVIEEGVCMHNTKPPWSDFVGHICSNR